MGRIQFDVQVPVDDEGLRANVRHALTLGLPELGRTEGDKAITIVANGPSAKPITTGDTLAVNGALRLFAPTYWAACDPQDLVADFIPENPPTDTTYLVASKCHPKVFERLRDRNVILWHLDDFATWELVKDRDAVPLSVSITLCAFALLKRLGYSRFETWGWDGCYLDGKDHAVPQRHFAKPINVEVGDQTFASHPGWALEAQDAVHKLEGVNVTINGGGMIGAILKELAA